MVASHPAILAGTGTEPEAAEPPEGSATAYAGVVTRTIAFTIDGLLIGAGALAVVGAALLIFAVFAIKGHHTLALVIGGAAFVVWVICYFTIFWTTTGQTPGNRVMHIRVVRSNGSRLRPHHAIARLGAMVLSLPLLWGYWPILSGARRRGVPDAMAGTVVVVVDPT
jgi:uncharacterized RDD family membrane protein YckC